MRNSSADLKDQFFPLKVQVMGRGEGGVKSREIFHAACVSECPYSLTY